ncbi:hypothetical protein HGRIS_003611 [Hohenbuehelia grisea]|uniref:DUF5648 domain-containing protein n=1 Tax=Hohenbuehelia grisea TaxID=104357 RepID=A0ABR3JGS3_9AGAR
MKFSSATFLTIALACVGASAAPKTKATQPPVHCAAIAKLAVPFYKSYNAHTVKHLYTPDVAKHNNALNSLKYRDQGVVGRVLMQSFVDPDGGDLTLPFYRFDHKAHANQIFTTVEKGDRDTVGYTKMRVEVYVFPFEVCGAIPLHRLYNARYVDHFYTTKQQEKDEYMAKYGYQYQGIAGFVLEA